MSMTSLQAQLAALNGSSGRHPGSIYASSRRPEDALGRGLHFRPQHGHVVAETIRFKATFIYPTAGEAANVPLKTLEENGRQAVEHLVEFDPNAVTFADNLQLVFHTIVDASKETLQAVLFHISTLLGEPKDAVVENCLHVLEYLLRRYKVHLTHLYEDLVWCFLPLHAQRASLVHRCLLLGDLAANQSYLFLRPYADPKNPAPIPRALLAQHIMKEVNLLRILCHMVRQATAFCDEATEQGKDTLRHGISHLFAWTAAIVVQGLAWQYKEPVSLFGDDRREALLRVLYPTVRHCCMSTHDAQMWGYIVASAAAETLELGDVVLGLWTVAMIEYAPSNNNNNIDDGQVWAALLSVLVPPHTSTAVVDPDSYLPLLQGKWLGCPLPNETFEALLANKSPAEIASILGELHQDLQVAPLFAAIVVRAVKTSSTSGLSIIQALLHEPRLESLWKQKGLDIFASTAAWVVTLAVAASEEKNASPFLQMLKDFHEYDPNEAEQGFAHALQQTLDEEERTRIIRVLQQVVSQESLNQKGDDKDVEMAVTLPRVALNDADAAVRLDAISKLLASASNIRTQQSLLDQLLRRWQNEADFSVAKALSKAISKITAFASSSSSSLSSSFLSFGAATDHPQLMLSGLYRWIESTEDEKFLQSSLQMMHYALHGISCNSREKQQMTEACVGYLFNRHKSVVQAACKAVSTNDKDSSLDAVAPKLLKDFVFLGGVRDGLRKGTDEHKMSSPAELATRARCAVSILSLSADHPEFISQENSAETCLDLACELFESSSAVVINTETQSKISKCLEECIPGLIRQSATIRMMVSLASVADEYYETVTRSVIKTVLAKAINDRGEQVSPVAILIEASLQPTLAPQTACRLLELAAEYASTNDSPVGSFPGIIPVLSLLEHDNEKIRNSAVVFLEKIGKRYGESSIDWSSCGNLAGLCFIYNDIFRNLSAGGQSRNYESLTAVVSKCVKQKKGCDARIALLRLCCLAARALDEADTLRKLVIVPPPQESFQTIESTAISLKAFELSGEEDFPLLERWKIVGVPLTAAILKQTNPSVVRSFSAPMSSVVTMLKGRYLTNSKVAFSSGPRIGGGRVRSYSLGSIDGTKTLDPFPPEMSDGLATIFKSRTLGGLEMAALVLKSLFLSSEWTEAVFSKIDAVARNKIFSAIIQLVEDDVSDAATTTFLRLPFDGSDVEKVLRDCFKEKPPIIQLIVSTTRFVSANAERLGQSTNVNEIIDILFEALFLVGESSGQYEGSEFEYCCQAILNCLNALASIAALPPKPTKTAVRFFPLLFALQQGGGKNAIRQLTSNKSRLAALRLSGTLAEKYPDEVLGTLRNTFFSVLQSNALDSLGRQHRITLISTILNIFWIHSRSSKVEYLEVLRDLIACMKEVSSDALIQDIVESLNIAPSVEESEDDLSPSCIGALACVAVAQHESKIATEIVHCAPRSSKLPSILQVLQYTKNLISEYNSPGETYGVKKPLPTHSDIMSIYFKTREPDAPGSALLALANDLVGVLRECLRMPDVQFLLKQGSREYAKYSLALWQDSLWLGAVGSATNDKSPLCSKFTTDMLEVRDDLQRVLPLSLFLASVSSLIKDDAKDMLPQGLALVAERVLDIDPNSPEAHLFLGIVPDICEVIENKDVWENASTTEIQSALLAVEHIGRTVALSDDTTDELASPFLFVLEKIAQSLETGMQKLGLENIKYGELEAAQRDLICSLALAGSTMVRIAKIKALPHVPRMISPLIMALSIANDESGRHEHKNLMFERDMQLATLRAIMAIAETAPQSLGTHLHLLMRESALLGPALRSARDHSLNQAISRLDHAIATNVPARMLIPVLGRAIEHGKSNDAAKVVISMLQMSVNGISSREAQSLKGSVFGCITKALDFDETSDEVSAHLLGQASAVLVSFVLKLSEGQLRRVYTALKDWKNEHGAAPGDSNRARRVAFWAISALLADQLKSLFLPCVSLVVEDLSLELKHAVSILCGTQVEKSVSGKKKRRLTADRIPHYPGFLLVLRNVLLFVERFLRADARDGGNWVRAEDSERFNIILDPLAKLLHSNLSFANENEGIPSYAAFVEGTKQEDGGNVIGCLTALAQAAGDEQLWKPLNHSVLEAAGTEGRSEVRKAGLSCLRSLIGSLGEEYMVLLPECLPVLSELLEDSNEEVAGLARDVITQAEDLLGESLDETLR